MLRCLAALCLSLPTFAALPETIETVGQYSPDYLSDWSKLPTGDQLARHDPAAFAWQEVIGEDVRRNIHDQDEVRLADLAWRVTWQGEANKMRTTLVTIRECKRVVIENVAILQSSPDFRGYDTIRIEDCDEVIVRNVYVAGPVQSAHLRLDGCGKALFDRVEVAGADDGQGGLRAGCGIFIQNGATGRGGPRDNMITTPNPRELTWLDIRNSWFHDYTAGDGTRRNQDAVLIHSPTGGIVFNNVVENWSDKVADAAMDIGFRRSDLANHTFRVERNLLRNCTLCKSPGDKGDPSNALIWCNNVFQNAFFGDYHGRWPLYLVHNTWLYDNTRGPVYKLWGTNEGPVIFENNLIWRTGEPAYQVVYQNDRKLPTRYRNTAFDHNLYLMSTPDAWVSGDGASVKEWAAWQAEGQDAHSVIADTADIFVDRVDGNLRPVQGSAAVGLGTGKYLAETHPGLAVTRDFLGRQRPVRPATGALEPDGP